MPTKLIFFYSCTVVTYETVTPGTKFRYIVKISHYRYHGTWVHENLDTTVECRNRPLWQLGTGR
eukprot:SAG11_NODE_2700_length_3076_cov_20.676520_4_plen_64_part_00